MTIPQKTIQLFFKYFKHNIGKKMVLIEMLLKKKKKLYVFYL